MIASNLAEATIIAMIAPSPTSDDKVVVYYYSPANDADNLAADCDAALAADYRAETIAVVDQTSAGNGHTSRRLRIDTESRRLFDARFLMIFGNLLRCFQFFEFMDCSRAATEGDVHHVVMLRGTKMLSSEDDRASPLDRDANLSQRVTCPCNQCKFGVRRQRRVMLQHVRDYGSFDPNTIDQAIADFNTLGSNSEHTPINLQPVRQARMRSTHHIGPSALHLMTPSSPVVHTIEVAPLEESDEDPSDMMLESEMNDMVEAIFEATDPTTDDMKQEARTALYEGSRISRLKTVLALLNLQASFETQESPMLWRLGEDERLTTDVAHGGGTSKRMDTTLEEKINRFCMLHHLTMDKWLTTYEIAKEERYDARRAFRARQRGRMVRYPPELEVLPRFMPLLWLHQQLTKAEEEGVHVSLEEWEFSRGCSDKVIFYPKPSDERWWYVIEVAPRGARIYENYNLITVADAEPIETEVAELSDIDVTMPEDDVEPIEIEVAEMPEDDIVDLNDIDFSLGGELTVDLEVGIELCQDALENT
ncbi:hypothetical protein L7F22_017407 [Adiantum nelumboides]|nr:hypothetical protein [Adiantum nelumboides]